MADMFTLTGGLHDHGDEPLAGVRVTAYPIPSRHVDTAGDVIYLGARSTRTAEDGSFSLELVTFPGLVYMVRYSANHTPSVVRFNAPAAGTVLDLVDVTPILSPSPMEEYLRGRPGLSAYEVWLADGNEGTLEEFYQAIGGGGGGGGGGGVTDHGALDGLADDDHSQYALADGTRGDFAASGHDHVYEWQPPIYENLEAVAEALDDEEIQIGQIVAVVATGT